MSPFAAKGPRDPDGQGDDDSQRSPRSASGPGEAGAEEHRAFDVSEMFRRLVEAGSKPGGVKQKAPELLRQLASELKVPKEVIAQTLSQLDETKQGVYRSIGREVHDLLERTSLSEELAKALSLLSLEIKMEVRFKPSNTKGPSHPSAGHNDSLQHDSKTRRDTDKTDANKTEK